MNTPALTPENAQLHRRFEELKKEFSDLFAVRDKMLRYDEPFLTALYVEKLGKLEFKIFRLRTEEAIAKLKISLMQKYINRNEKINYNEIDKQIDYAMAEQKKIMEEQEKQIRRAKEFLASDALTAEETKEMQAIYRSLVKRLHPDLHPRQTEEEKDLFLRVKAAYELCRLNDLRQIMLSMSIGGEADLPEISLADEVKKLETQTAEINKQIEEMNARFPFTQKEKLHNDKEIAEKQKKLNAEISELEEKCKVLKIQIGAMKSWKQELLS